MHTNNNVLIGEGLEPPTVRLAQTAFDRNCLDSMFIIIFAKIFTFVIFSELITMWTLILKMCFQIIACILLPKIYFSPGILKSQFPPPGRTLSKILISLGKNDTMPPPPPQGFW